MPLLSQKNLPLPPLCDSSSRLLPDAQQRLDEKLLPRLGPELASNFWGLVRKLDAMLKDVFFANAQRPEANEARHRLLESMQAIMHDLSALTEYLGDVLATAIPSAGKKNKAANRDKDKLEAIVNRTFKVPINLVKHARFRLQWLECFTDSEMTTGFILGGIVEPYHHGPASHRYPGVAEGYSFAFILRQVLPSYFRLCEIAEEALVEAKLFGPIDEAKPVGSLSLDLALLQTVVDRLAALPVRGFPNEANTRVPQLVLKDHALAVGTQFRLLGFKAGCRFSYEATAVNGQAFRIPYWLTAT